LEFKKGYNWLYITVEAYENETSSSLYSTKPVNGMKWWTSEDLSEAELEVENFLPKTKLHHNPFPHLKTKLNK
jgi:hypothetical protein